MGEPCALGDAITDCIEYLAESSLLFIFIE